MIDWQKANLDLRAARAAMDAVKRRERQQAEAIEQMGAARFDRRLPEVRLGGH